jgi:hypothetical protein
MSAHGDGEPAGHPGWVALELILKINQLGRARTSCGFPQQLAQESVAWSSSGRRTDRPPTVLQRVSYANAESVA